jgi:hypothetical protein
MQTRKSRPTEKYIGRFDSMKARAMKPSGSGGLSGYHQATKNAWIS